MSQITTHILDTASGTPASGVPLTLSQQTSGGWKTIASGTTNNDGRVSEFLPTDKVLDAGNYKIFFDTQHYFSNSGATGFYPWVEIVFVITGGGQHYHIPLLLSPFGYSTYRGS